MKNFVSMLLFVLLLQSSCKKNETPTPNPCAGVTLAITIISSTPSGAGAADGAITVTGPLGTNFLYKIGTNDYTANRTFLGLAAGTYTITVRNTEGCTATKQVTIL